MVFFSRPLYVILTHTFPEPLPRALAPAVPPTLISDTVTPPLSHAPRALPPPGELLFPSALLDLAADAAAAVLAPAATSAVNAADTAALMPPEVRSFECIAVVTSVKIMVRIYY